MSDFAEIDGIKIPRPKNQNKKPKVFNSKLWPFAIIAFSEPTDRYVLWFISNYKYAFNSFYNADFSQWMKQPVGDISKYPLYKYQLVVKSLMDRHLVKFGDKARLTLVLTFKGKLFRLTTHPGWPIIPVLFAALVAFSIFGLNKGCSAKQKELEQTSTEQSTTAKDFLEELTGNVESVEEETKRALYELKVWREDPSDSLYNPKLKLYDKNGNLLKEQEYFNQNFYDAIVYEYDEGKLIRFLEYGMDKKLNHVNTILKGESVFKIIEMLTESHNEDLSNDTTFFTWKNNRIVKISSSKRKNYFALEYNKKGHLSKTTAFNSSGVATEKLAYEYLEFDKNKNWTKRVRYNSDNLADYPVIFIRKIKYY